MNSTFEETFEYRHKKFDQLKSLRTDSISSSDEYECIKVEIERLDEVTYSQITSETSTTYTTSNWSASQATTNPMGATKRPRVTSTNESLNSPVENYAVFEAPTAKRMRTSSVSKSTYSSSFLPSTATPTLRHTSTPHNTTAIPMPLITVDVNTAAAILPKISDETLRNICKYHGNMVRKFPKKERTPKDQDRRNKNTIACRMSRRVKKLEHIAIEEQYKDFSQQVFDIIERSMRATAYLNELMKLSAVSNDNQNGSVTSLATHKKLLTMNDQSLSLAGEKKPFTIAFLAGHEE